MRGQQKTDGASSPLAHGAVLPDYTAAVRYLDGRRDIFLVRNACDIADARSTVLNELGVVRSLVITLRH